MKKFILFIALLATIFIFASCSKKEQTLTILTASGAPEVSLAKINKDKKIGNYNVKIETFTQPIDAQSAFTNNSYDVIIAPVNLGFKLYNLGKSKYQFLNQVTGSNLYIASKQNITDESILKQTTMTLFGATTLNYEVANKLLDGKVSGFSETAASANDTLQLLLKSEATNNESFLVSEPQLSAYTYSNPSTTIYSVPLSNYFTSQYPNQEYIQAACFVKEGTTKELATEITNAIKDSIEYLIKPTVESISYIKSNYALFSKIADENFSTVITKCGYKYNTIADVKTTIKTLSTEFTSSFGIVVDETSKAYFEL